VRQYPAVYQRIREEGHAVGNHTYQHLNGWKAGTEKYLQDITNAAALIQSNLFRPPYGRIKTRQAKRITAALNDINARVIMWDVLSADFDRNITAQQCLENVLNNYCEGSIIVFHDSEKAFPHLQNVLPKILEHLQKENYRCRELRF
jgi:peptidoglycan/xylan/chitin deacetylase (PgdA/CDA1 family)